MSIPKIKRIKKHEKCIKNGLEINHNTCPNPQTKVMISIKRRESGTDYQIERSMWKVCPMMTKSFNCNGGIQAQFPILNKDLYSQWGKKEGLGAGYRRAAMAFRSPIGPNFQYNFFKIYS